MSVDGELPGVVFPTSPPSIGKVLQKLEKVWKVRVSIVGHKVESSDSSYKIQPEEDIVLEVKAVRLRPALALAPESFTKLVSGSAHPSLIGARAAKAQPPIFFANLVAACFIFVGPPPRVHVGESSFNLFFICVSLA